MYREKRRENRRKEVDVQSRSEYEKRRIEERCRERSGSEDLNILSIVCLSISCEEMN